MDSLTTIKSFTDLKVWAKAHELIMIIYKITRAFSKEERFGLTNQICRAVVSVTSNIAEGFSRRGYKEKLQFYYVAFGSLTEVQNQLLISRDLNYFDQKDFDDIVVHVVSVYKLLNAFISKTKSYIPDSKF